MSKPLRLAITTLGCKVNRVDGERLLARLGERVVVVPFAEVAEVYLVNSCTVTAVAERQTRQLIYRARRRNPKAQVVLTGCLAAVAPERGAGIDGVDHVFPLARHDDLVAHLLGLADAADRAPSPPPAEAGALAPRTRPFLKVQDGCDASCTYCIVPRARGPSRSTPGPEVVAALDALARGGAAEVVLTGIHLGRYGADLSPPSSLCRLLGRLRGRVPRLRLSSVEPLEVDGALARRVTERDPAICPHLHVPLQSADDEVLAAMNRPYRVAEVDALLRGLRQARPGLALGSDLMAGFPGETEAHFARTLERLSRWPLTHLHVFCYSVRPGTPAAELPGQVPGPEARRRAGVLRRLGEEKLAAFAQRQLGQVRQVLVERVHPGRGEGWLAGLSDNYLRVALPGGAAEVGRLLRVRLLRREGTELVGEGVG